MDPSYINVNFSFVDFIDLASAPPHHLGGVAHPQLPGARFWEQHQKAGDTSHLFLSIFKGKKHIVFTFGLGGSFVFLYFFLSQNKRGVGIGDNKLYGGSQRGGV